IHMTDNSGVDCDKAFIVPNRGCCPVASSQLSLEKNFVRYPLTTPMSPPFQIEIAADFARAVEWAASRPSSLWT
ncbi:MAG TPA: hypothetical protein VF772_04810, partial [Terriglobales bacterium]